MPPTPQHRGSPRRDDADAPEAPTTPRRNGREIPQLDALRLQLAAIVGQEPAESVIEVRPLAPDGRPATRERAFIPVGQPGQVARLVGTLAPRLHVYVGVAPRVRQAGTADAVERVWTLWADIDGPDALRRLSTFDPLPSIVIRTGSDHCAHAYWPLDSPLTPQWAQRANRRLAHALGADMAATDPARILRPAGSLNHKTSPPRPVICTRLTGEVFDSRDVVGTLPDDRDYTKPPQRQRPRPSSTNTSGDPSRVLAGLARTVAEAQVGNRNASLFWAACRVREHADAGDIDAETALADLRAAARTAGLGDIEIEQTLHSSALSRAAA